MNWEAIYFMYYLYTSFTGIFVVLAMGKFFCVRRIYDLYDAINKFTDDALPFIVSFSTTCSVLSGIFIYFKWEFLVLIFCIAMALTFLVFVVYSIVGILIGASYALSEWHKRIKKLKNMR